MALTYLFRPNVPFAALNRLWHKWHEIYILAQRAWPSLKLVNQRGNAVSTTGRNKEVNCHRINTTDELFDSCLLRLKFPNNSIRHHNDANTHKDKPCMMMRWRLMHSSILQQRRQEKSFKSPSSPPSSGHPINPHRKIQRPRGGKKKQNILRRHTTTTSTKKKKQSPNPKQTVSTHRSSEENINKYTYRRPREVKGER